MWLWQILLPFSMPGIARSISAGNKWYIGGLLKVNHMKILFLCNSWLATFNKLSCGPIHRFGNKEIEITREEIACTVENLLYAELFVRFTIFSFQICRCYSSVIIIIGCMVWSYCVLLSLWCAFLLLYVFACIFHLLVQRISIFCRVKRYFVYHFLFRFGDGAGAPSCHSLEMLLSEQSERTTEESMYLHWKAIALSKNPSNHSTFVIGWFIRCFPFFFPLWFMGNFDIENIDSSPNLTAPSILSGEKLSSDRKISNIKMQDGTKILFHTFWILFTFTMSNCDFS